jgi:hypothetical protein
LLSLVPKGAPVVGAPAGVTPTGVPNITKGTLQWLSDNSVVLTMPDGTKLTGLIQKGTDRINFSLQTAQGASITGVLTMQVGEPFTGAYVITDTGGRVFTVRQEYTKQ